MWTRMTVRDFEHLIFILLLCITTIRSNENGLLLIEQPGEISSNLDSCTA